MRLTKIPTTIAFAVLLAGFAIAYSNSVMAQQKSAARPFVMAVIDMNRVQREAAAAKDIRTQMDARRAAYQGQVQQEEAKLRTAYQELTQKKGVLSIEAFEVERRKFDERKNEAQRKMQGFSRELEKAGARGRDAIVTKLQQVIETLVKSKGITLLLRKDQLVYTDTNYEVTEYVIKALDRALPSVKIFGPKAETK